jgi:hypothetical protein
LILPEKFFKRVLSLGQRTMRIPWFAPREISFNYGFLICRSGSPLELCSPPPEEKVCLKVLGMVLRKLFPICRPPVTSQELALSFAARPLFNLQEHRYDSGPSVTNRWVPVGVLHSILSHEVQPSFLGTCMDRIQLNCAERRLTAP